MPGTVSYRLHAPRGLSNLCAPRWAGKRRPTDTPTVVRARRFLPVDVELHAAVSQAALEQVVV
jgi:hypothetical protein